jgi:hypothetical protein
MIYTRNDSGYTYSIGDNSLYLGASAGTTGNNDNVTAKYSGSDGPIQSGSSDSAWSANDIPIGTTSTITYTIPTYYTADFTSTGIDITGSSVSGKTVTISGKVTGDVSYGFENYRQNTFSASANMLSVVQYGRYTHPAYAFVYEFGSADPEYILDTAHTRVVTINDAWYNYNGTVYYDELSSADVNVPANGLFVSGIKDCYIKLSLSVPYSAATYSDTAATSLPVRYCFYANGYGSNFDWSPGVKAGVMSNPFSRTATYTASANLNPQGTYNTISSLGGWVEQGTFSSKYNIDGSLSGAAFISGIAP